jgi:hypothetical protein
LQPDGAIAPKEGAEPLGCSATHALVDALPAFVQRNRRSRRCTTAETIAPIASTAPTATVIKAAPSARNSASTAMVPTISARRVRPTGPNVVT